MENFFRKISYFFADLALRFESWCVQVVAGRIREECKKGSCGKTPQS